MPTLMQGRCGIAILAAVLIALCLAAPATAEVKYTQGSPEFTAMVVGTNEFSPGEETTVQILIRNTGLNLFKEVNDGTIAQDDLPNTAKWVTAGLTSNTPSIIIRSDSRYVGDIEGNGGSATAGFVLKVTSDAAEQEYQLPLSISYQVPVVTTQPSSESYQYVYTKANVTVPVTIRIKQGVILRVLDVASDNATAGAEGIIRVRIQNSGPGTGKDAILKISRNAKSPVIPVDTTIYLGEFAAGEIAEARFRVSVSDDAGGQTYPVDIAITYENSEGSDATTDPVTIGITVLDKPEFEVISPSAQVAAGSTATITVRFRNMGAATIYSAQAGISDHSPITVENDVAYLGDLGPGESVDTLFTVQADSSAEPGEYSFDSRVRYRDASGTSIQSDTADLVITVLPAENGIMDNPVVLLLIVGIVLTGIVLLAYRSRKGNQ